ncbi:flagellar filament capping protein FliD [Actinoplanes sp. NBC_00393]|uniref:flagellar filament capping protein FliD n=1 Tax=Actinoplanes sp. NBC_00393 TaxID=2975953 RepID=UPI002E1A0D94
MTSSIDGLVSGLSTSSMISQLMQVEAAPQTKLKTKVKTAETAVASYQSVNSKLKAFKSAADELGQLSTWRAVKATSNSDTVTATAAKSLSSAAGSVTFDVKQLAKSQVTSLHVDTTAVLNTSLTITPPGKYKTDGTWEAGTPMVVNVEAPATGTAADLVAAVNAKGLDVRAHLVKTADGTGVMQFTSSKTGAEYGFTVQGLENKNLDGDNQPVTTAAQNAVLKLAGAGGYEVTSSTNTFTGLLPNVTVVVSKETTGVTVDATPDVSGIAAKVQAMVEAMNATLTEVKTQTAYDPATKASSPLTGDFMVRDMTQSILGAVSTGLSEYPNPRYDKNGPVDSVANPKTLPFGSLSQLGIELSRDGQLTFDSAAFTATYNADPARVQGASIALAEKFESLADKRQTNVTAVITGRKNEIDSINDQISNWDIRLTNRREALQRQYAALETALGKLNNQSSWLSGQLAGLG